MKFHKPYCLLKSMALVVFLVIGVQVRAQQNFNEYKTLQSVGQIPNDFSAFTYAKVKEDLENNRTQLKGKKERIFLEGIHYSIDELLHSGMVIYGDEVTKYITDVAGKLLKNNPELKDKIRFYTIKSNTTNAFSTDQGIVFVTTGLISQLTSEAQLAFVLAHEISHYTLKHVVEGFEFKTKTSRKDRTIEKLSQYSKEKEFEADKIGLKLYQEAGYSKAEILPAFDVLMFSYLPFDEEAFPLDYLNTSKFYIPTDLFPTEKYPIKAKEDTDDSKSSHPNIMNRKSAAEKEIGNYGDWGSNVNFFGETRFKEVRNIARFESIRNDVIDANYVDALYSIFILEKVYPNSIYLERMKAKSWLGLSQLKDKNKLNNHLQKTSEYEGEIAALHFLMRKMDNLAVMATSLRQVEDIRMKHRDDKEIIAVWERMVKTAALSSKFELAGFSKFDYATAKLEFDKMKADTTVKETPSSTENLTKYEKIKKKKNTDNAENFDAKKFYLYGLSDLIQDEHFLASYRKYKDIEEEKEKERKEFEAKPYSERKKLNKIKNKNLMRLDVKEMIYVEPVVYHITQSGVDLTKSEKLAKEFAEAVKLVSEELNMTVTTINRANMKTLGSAGFNERATLLSYLNQLAAEDNIEVFPVDYELLEDIKLNYSTSKVMFSIMEHQYRPNLVKIIIPAVLFFPVALIMGPTELIKANRTEFSVIVMDIDQSKVIGGVNYEYREPLSKLSMAAHIYDVFYKINSKPL